MTRALTDYERLAMRATARCVDVLVATDPSDHEHEVVTRLLTHLAHWPDYGEPECECSTCLAPALW